MLAERLAERLDRDAGIPLGRQIYGEIRRLILEGALKSSQRLPASRALAGELGVGRNTVIDAYAQLTAEGYLQGRVGSGSYVAATGPDLRPELGARVVGARRRSPAALSRRGEAVLREPGLAERGAFAACAPDPGMFPFAQWQRLLGRGWRMLRERDAHYATPGGHPELRAAIADYLALARGVRCEATQVVIVAGAQHGLDLCARLLADAGDRVWVEDPGYPGARRVFHAANLELVPIPVDAQGMAPAAAQWRKPPRLVYITPSHQFPTGVVMTLERRRALLEAASRHGSWIVEDDYDGEFRYSGRPLAALQGIDAADRVVYVGTFSKALFPGLRLGYLVVPAALQERFALAAARLSFEGRQVTQGALAAFIREGYFAAHVRRMRSIYAVRREVLADTWRRELGGYAPLEGAEAGLHVVARLPRGRDRAVSAAAERAGIVAQSLHSLYLGRADRSGLVLGYGTVHEREIRRQGANLARLVARLR